MMKVEKLAVGIKIPHRFYTDHMERGLEAPKVLRWYSTHLIIDGEDPAVDELLSDAEYYATPGIFEPEYAGLASSARATVKAIQAYRSSRSKKE
jgi:hypothetical protein